MRLRLAVVSTLALLLSVGCGRSTNTGTSTTGHTSGTTKGSSGSTHASSASTGSSSGSTTGSGTTTGGSSSGSSHASSSGSGSSGSHSSSSSSHSSSASSSSSGTTASATSGTTGASSSSSSAASSTGGASTGSTGGTTGGNTDLIFSEYVEGSASNKAIEIYNGTASTVSLANYQIKMFTNGGATASATLVLSGTLAPGAVYAICNSQASAALKAHCNISPSSGVTGFNGNDGLLLERVSTGAIVDRFGDNTNPGTAWTGGGVSTVDHTLRRKCSVTAGDTDFTAPFNPSTEWDQFPIDSFDDVGLHTCVAGSTGSTGSTSSGSTSSSGGTGASGSTGSTGSTGTSGGTTGSALAGVFFSEYVEGSASNKALEIVNRTGAPVDLSQVQIKLFTNGSVTAQATLTLSGTLGDGQVFSICHPSASATLKARCTQIASSSTPLNVTNFNGNDALQLLETATGVIIDRIGDGTGPSTAWTKNGVSTLDHTLRRKCSITVGDPDFTTAFDPSAQWDQFPVDSFDDIGLYCGAGTTGSTGSSSSSSSSSGSTGTSGSSSSSGSTGSGSTSGSTGTSSSSTGSTGSTSGSTGSGTTGTSGTSGAAHTNLLFTEYVEGQGGDQAVEIFNGTTAPVDLSGYQVLVFADGASAATGTFPLTGTLAPGQLYVLCGETFGVLEDGGLATAACTARTTGPLGFDGDDGLQLVLADGGLVDSFGELSQPDGGAWVSADGGVSTRDQDLRRLCSVTTGDTDFADAFDPATQWSPFAADDFSDLGSYTCPTPLLPERGQLALRALTHPWERW